MKLHLPVVLFTALMAVMTSLTTYAAAPREEGIQAVSEVSDITITADTPAFDDERTVVGNITMNSAEAVLDVNGELVVSGGTLREGTWKSSENTGMITVQTGGSLSLSNYAEINSRDYNGENTLILNLEEGSTYDVGEGANRTNLAALRGSGTIKLGGNGQWEGPGAFDIFGNTTREGENVFSGVIELRTPLSNAAADQSAIINVRNAGGTASVQTFAGVKAVKADKQFDRSVGPKLVINDGSTLRFTCPENRQNEFAEVSLDGTATLEFGVIQGNLGHESAMLKTDKFEIEADSAILVSWLGEAPLQSGEATINLIEGRTTIYGGGSIGEKIKFGSGWGVIIKGVSVDSAGDTLKITVTTSSDNVWYASKQEQEGETVSALASDLAGYDKVVVDKTTAVNVTESGMIKQLEGKSNLSILGSGELSLENSGTYAGSIFEGDLGSEEGVALKKTGDAELTLKGNLKADGAVNVAAGTLVLAGGDNTVAGALGMEEEGTLQVKHTLTLSGTSNLIAGTLTGDGTITVAEGGSLTVGSEVTLSKDLSLQVDGDLTLYGEHVRAREGDGKITGSGTLTVGRGGNLSITETNWSLTVSGINVAGTLSQKKSPITADNIVVKSGGKWTQESDASYYPWNNTWNDTVTRADVAQSITVENNGSVEQKGTSFSADTITVTGTWTQNKITFTDDRAEQSWMKSHDVHAETRANSIVVQAGGNYNLMDGAIAALGGADNAPGTLDLQVSGTFTMSNGDVAEGGSANIIVERGGEFKMEGSGNVAGADYKGDSQARISIRGGDFTLSGNASIGNATTSSWDEKQSCTSTVIIEITEDGGNFTLSGNGQIGIASGYGDTSDITINVKGGKFLVKNDNSTQNSLGEAGQASEAGYINKAGVGINVSGNGQFVLAEGGIGCADFVFQANGQCSASTKITVTDSGSFTMEGGNLGCKLSNSASLSTALHIELHDQGQMQISGGKVGEGATLEIFDAATLVLDDSEEKGASKNLAITMHGGNLEGGAGYQGNSVTIATDSEYSGTIKLGGLDPSKITSLKANGANVWLEQIGEGTLNLTGGDRIKLGHQSVWVQGAMPEDNRAVFQFENSGTVDVTGEGQFILDLSEDAIKSLRDGTGSWEVWITNGQLQGEQLEQDASQWAKDHFVVGTGWGLTVKDYRAEEGKLILTGETHIWDAKLDGEPAGKEQVSVSASTLDGGQYDKVIIDEDTELTADHDVTLKQLTGSRDLDIKKDDEGTEHTITLHNEDTLAAENSGDTEYSGDITTEGGIILKKTGDADLTVKGDLNAGGDVTVEDGKLALSGNDSSIGGKLSVAKDAELQVDGKLTLSAENDLSTDDSGTLTGSGSITVGKDGKLTLKSDTVNDSDLTFGADAGGRLELTGDVPVDLKKLAEDTTGTVKGAEFTSTDKDASFAGSIEGKLTVKGGSLNMSNTENGGCDLYVVGKDTQATIAAGSKYHSIAVGDNDRDNDKLVVSANEENGKAGAGIRVTGDIVFRRGAETDFTLNLNDPDLWGSGEHDATMLSTERTIYIEQGTTFVIDCLESSLSGTHNDLRDVVILEGTNIENPEAYNAPITARILVSDALSENTREGEKEVVKADVRLGTILDQLYENVKMTQDGQKVYINADARTESPWMSYATTGNSVAGLNLLWKALSNAGGAVDPQVEGMFHALQNLLNESPAEARRVMAAVAGSTLTSLSAAQSAALRNQMGRVRDHALQAGRLRCMGNDEATAQQRPCKNSHVWVEGTGFFSEQHSVGDESGYRLNSWGGALGIDAQVDAHWSVGVSLSASYGDLEARAADYAKGDLDTYTVSFWSQAKNGRWGNILLFTLGTNEADLKRTVNYGAGSYTATSNTSGSSLGAMWELTYDFHPVKDNKSNILQPLFNVAVMHTSMDGFSEKNAGGVGLTTEKQTRDTMTLGLGLRWLAAINSAKAVNRTVSTEVHANVAQDLGDRRSVANVALLADPNFAQNVYGSKTGSTAFQFGAGVNVPMTPNSQIYVNAGGELREHANAWNAALGVRMGF